MKHDDDQGDITSQILELMPDDLDEDTRQCVAMALDIYHTRFLLPALQHLFNKHKQSITDQITKIHPALQKAFDQQQQFIMNRLLPAPVPQKAKGKAGAASVPQKATGQKAKGKTGSATQLLAFYRALADKQGRFTMKGNNRRFMDQHQLSNEQITLLAQQLQQAGQIRQCDGKQQWQITA